MWPCWASHPICRLKPRPQSGTILAPAEGLAKTSVWVTPGHKTGQLSFTLLVPHGATCPKLSRYQVQLGQLSESVYALYPGFSESKILLAIWTDLLRSYPGLPKAGRQFDHVGHLWYLTVHKIFKFYYC